MMALFLAFSLTARSKPLSDSFFIGKPCPQLHLRNIENWDKKDAFLQDFRGKWLVLDFWNKGCVACVGSFPKTNALKAKFGDKVEFMLVALQDKEDAIHPLWRQYRDAQKLTMPCAFDSFTFQQFGFYACPRVIIIDDKGIVRGSVYGISDSDMSELLAGKRQYLTNPEPIAFDWRAPFLLNGNGGNDTDFVYRSVIARWNNSMAAFRPGIVAYAEGLDLFQASKESLASLYNLAYFGKSMFAGGTDDPDYAKICLKPVLEMGDTSRFAADYPSGQNLFAYSLSVRGGGLTSWLIRETLQHDLASYFRYTAAVEIRDCPYLALVVDDSARKKLLTKGGPKFYFVGSPHGNYSYSNTTIANFLFLVGQSFSQETILVDETGIQGNIDITMTQLATDPSSVLNALHANGLNLVWRKRPMRVVVIKGPGSAHSVISIPDTTNITWR